MPVTATVVVASPVAWPENSIEAMHYVPPAETVAMPSLTFVATPADEATFDKYYVFHRADTTFAEAFADIRDCDSLARGLNSGIARVMPYTPYGGVVGGAIGGAIGSALADAISGSAQRRAMRRDNMRHCMHYKGYGRYGLSKAVWEPFNFEEGLSKLSEPKRQMLLAQQARVASAPTVIGKDLGL